ncbi:MAG TPA: hypothetical protein PKD91_06690 [Bacteroidia bacterium]|nr:hypothetical protein [Bacteroidia bacterium]
MFNKLNNFIFNHIANFELIGVIMRIISFSLVSWLGPESPFMFVWIFNTVDAILLTWCALLRKDKAYTLLNGFWILVGLIGILRAANMI